MSVQQLMTRDPVTVEMDDTVATVREIFDHVRFHHLLVVERGRLCGVVSDRDLFKALSPYLGTPAESSKDAATLHRRVHQIMSRHPVVIGPHATVFEAVDLIVERGVSCLPVVDPEGAPLGIVTWRDVLQALRRTPSAPPA